jgi:MOSC domain-containing protein
VTYRGHVVSLFVYPVKGLSGQPLQQVSLSEHRGFPGDREFALARPDGDYRPGSGEALPKSQFFMLARDERLAGLNTHLDSGTRHFSVIVAKHVVHESSWDSADGRQASAEFFARVLDLPPGQIPFIANEADRRFTDVSVVSDPMMHAVSVINLASVRALEERIGRPVDPLRFRANVYVDGWPAFAELNLLSQRSATGRQIRLGGVRLQAVLNTRRCAATEVNPASARRDIALPRLIFEHYGHSEMGVYGETLEGGDLAIGDPAELTGLRASSPDLQEHL